MATTCDLQELSKAITKGQKGIGKIGKSLPVLHTVLLRRVNSHVEIVSTDLEKWARGTCRAIATDRPSDDKTLWEICIDPRGLNDWLKAWEVKGKKIREVVLGISKKGETLIVEYSDHPGLSAVATFKGIQGQEFPYIDFEKDKDREFK